MKLQVVGCSHHSTPIEFRERLAFSPEEACDVLDRWNESFPGIEAVLLSTCNRTEIYAATENGEVPSQEQIATFLAQFHDLDAGEVNEHLYQSETMRPSGTCSRWPAVCTAWWSARPRSFRK